MKNEKIICEIPAVTTPAKSKIAAKAYQERRSGTKNPKKKVVHEKPDGHSRIRPVAWCLRRTCIVEFLSMSFPVTLPKSRGRGLKFLFYGDSVGALVDGNEASSRFLNDAFDNALLGVLARYQVFDANAYVRSEAPQGFGFWLLFAIGPLRESGHGNACAVSEILDA